MSTNQPKCQGFYSGTLLPRRCSVYDLLVEFLSDIVHTLCIPVLICVLLYYTVESTLQRCLPDKVFSKYSEAQSRDALEAAKIEGLVTCHKCSSTFVMEPEDGK
jgi:hypothetical protein